MSAKSGLPYSWTWGGKGGGEGGVPSLGPQTQAQAVQAAGSQGLLCTLTPCLAPPPPPSPGKPSPRPSETDVRKEPVCAQTCGKCSARSSDLAASMKTSHPGIAGQNPGGRPETTLSSSPPGEKPSVGGTPRQARPPATGLLCPRVCSGSGLSRTRRRGSHSPGGSTGRGTSAWGPLFPWLDARRGCQEICPLQGETLLLSSYGRDSKERRDMEQSPIRKVSV